MHAGRLAHVGCCVLLFVGCGDDSAGDPTGGSEATSAGGSSDGVGTVGSGANSTGGGETSETDETAGAETAGAETAAAPDLDDIVGDWEAIDTFNPDRPDEMAVRADATATAAFRYLVDGNPWEVRLEATIVAGDAGFDFAFFCDNPEPACVALEFDSHCEHVLDQLVCSAPPEWYYKPEFVFDRVPSRKSSRSPFLGRADRR